MLVETLDTFSTNIPLAIYGNQLTTSRSGTEPDEGNKPLVFQKTLNAQCCLQLQPTIVVHGKTTAYSLLN